MLVRSGQLKKARLPISVTVLGIEMFVTPALFENVEPPMPVSLSGLARTGNPTLATVISFIKAGMVTVPPDPV